jgi:hypothetical protein
MKTPPRLHAAQTRLLEVGRRITGLLYRIDQLGTMRLLDPRARRAVLDAESFLMRARARLEARGAFIIEAWRRSAFSAYEASERLDDVVDELLEELEQLSALPLLEPGDLH